MVNDELLLDRILEPALHCEMDRTNAAYGETLVYEGGGQNTFGVWVTPDAEKAL
jgi:hypothetical protein